MQVSELDERDGCRGCAECDTVLRDAVQEHRQLRRARRAGGAGRRRTEGKPERAGEGCDRE
ncbi:MAG TPA: hypothetical protein VF321_02910 [Gaiellaceae bacterium]